LKKNGFFDDNEPLNSHRANEAAKDNMLNDMTKVEQLINSSNANTDRGHHHGMLINPEMDQQMTHFNDALIIKNNMKYQKHSLEDKSQGMGLI
jgi:hypothetical protein